METKSIGIGNEVNRMGERIEHTGVVESVEGGKVCVQIERQSACAGCHARDLCSIDKKKQVLTLEMGAPVKKGDVVTVVGEGSLGMRAVVLAFGVPLVLMVLVMFLVSRQGAGEVMVAVSAIGMFLVYYIVLYAFRSRLERKFRFSYERR